MATDDLDFIRQQRLLRLSLLNSNVISDPVKTDHEPVKRGPASSVGKDAEGRSIVTLSDYQRSDNEDYRYHTVTNSNRTQLLTREPVDHNHDNDTSRDATVCKPSKDEEFELFVVLPSFDITKEQFVEYVRIQYGIDIIVRHLNEKRGRGNVVTESEHTYCFVACKSSEDQLYLVKNMNGGVIGDWEAPIKVQVKKEKTANS